MTDDSTTQILTIIRDDVREVRRDVKAQGERLATIHQAQKAQHADLELVRNQVELVSTAHFQCTAPSELVAIKKRLSDVSQLAQKPLKVTPRDGFKIQVETQGFWKKALPWIIGLAIGGAGAAMNILEMGQ
jgi:hypothetical protein